MSVPILTIPESVFNPSGYIPSKHTRRSRLLRFILTLTHTSAAALLVVYIVGILAIRPLMATTVSQRLEFLEACRIRLRSLYLAVIGKVDNIPIIGIERGKHGAIKKIYADSVCQTDDLDKKMQADKKIETLGQDSVCDKLKVLETRLGTCRGFRMQDMGHFKAIDFAVKDLHQKVDMVYFDQKRLMAVEGPNSAKNPRNLVQEVKRGIREIKGMYMTGRA